MEQDKLLEDGEIMLEGVRKHWIVYVEDFLIHFFGCVLFICIAGYLSLQGVVPYLSSDNKAHIAMILVLLVLIFWTSFFYFWTKHYFDVWYITDRHIIAVDQKDMFAREHAYVELTKIQDVSFEKNGFLGTFLGYGKLKIQTAGSDQQFMIADVQDVEVVVHRIMELRDAKNYPKA